LLPYQNKNLDLLEASILSTLLLFTIQDGSCMTVDQSHGFLE